jgi:hypothetical protein
MNLDEILLLFRTDLDSVSASYGRLGASGFDRAKTENEVKHLFVASYEDLQSGRSDQFFALIRFLLRKIELLLESHETTNIYLEFLTHNSESIQYATNLLLEHQNCDSNQQRLLGAFCWAVSHPCAKTPEVGS